MYANTPTQNMHIHTSEAHIPSTQTHVFPQEAETLESRCDPASGTLRTCLQSEHVELRPLLALSPPKGVGTLPALEQGSDIPMHPSLHVNTQPVSGDRPPYDMQAPLREPVSRGAGEGQKAAACSVAHRALPGGNHLPDRVSQQKGTNQLPPEEENL